MVKTIAKTYSVENDQIKKSVTFSTEESLPSQSSESYSHSPYHHGLPLLQPPRPPSVPHENPAPVRYGFIDDSGVIHIGFGALVMDYPFSSQSPVSYSSNTPVKYGFG